MKLNKKIGIFLLVLIAVFATVSCSDSKKSSSKKGNIKIGAILPMSGDGGADQGLASQKSITLAVEEINKAGGINGRKLEAIYEDSACEPTKGVTAVNKLIDQDKVDFIIGDICDGVTAPIMKIAQDKGVVLITPGSTAPAISDAGDHIFRFWFSEDDMGNAVANDAKAADLSNFAIIYINNAWGQAQEAAVSKYVEANGGKVVSKQSVEPDTTDYRTLLLKAEESDPDAYYIGTFPNGLASFMEQRRIAGITKPVYAHGGLVGSTLALDLGGTDLEGISAPFVSDGDPTFVEKFNARFNEAPGVTADSSYDIVNAIAQVMKDEKDFNSDTLMKNLSGLKDYKGASGTITVDKNGDTKRSLVVSIVKDRKLVVK